MNKKIITEPIIVEEENVLKDSLINIINYLDNIIKTRPRHNNFKMELDPYGEQIMVVITASREETDKEYNGRINRESLEEKAREAQKSLIHYHAMNYIKRLKRSLRINEIYPIIHRKRPTNWRSSVYSPS